MRTWLLHLQVWIDKRLRAESVQKCGQKGIIWRHSGQFCDTGINTDIELSIPTNTEYRYWWKIGILEALKMRLIEKLWNVHIVLVPHIFYVKSILESFEVKKLPSKWVRQVRRNSLCPYFDFPADLPAGRLCGIRKQTLWRWKVTFY